MYICTYIYCLARKALPLVRSLLLAFVEGTCNWMCNCWWQQQSCINFVNIWPLLFLYSPPPTVTPPFPLHLFVYLFCVCSAMGTTFSTFTTCNQVQSGPEPTVCLATCVKYGAWQKAKARRQLNQRDNNYEGGNQIHRHLKLQFHFNMRRLGKEQKEVATKPQQQTWGKFEVVVLALWRAETMSSRRKKKLKLEHC